MTGQRFLLLSVSAGAGHRRAAEAIQAAVAHRGDSVQVRHLDVMDFVSSSFRTLYTDVYLRLIGMAPSVWRYLYDLSNRTPPDSPGQRLRRAVERLSARQLMAEIDGWQPDAIVCTHFLPAEILFHQRRKGRVGCPIWLQVTDFDVHRMWAVPDMGGYGVASDEAAHRLTALGIDPARIHVTGIPLMPAFATRLDRSTCMAELGLEAARPTALLMGGGEGLGALDAVTVHLLETVPALQLIVLTGKNAALKARLDALQPTYGARLSVQGFTHQVERLMTCADVVITKPGGLTTAECLAMGRPMIVNSPIPGQEERNADLLLEAGAALKAVDGVTLAYRVQQLMDDPVRLGRMSEAARVLGRPRAAAAVVDRVLSPTFVQESASCSVLS